MMTRFSLRFGLFFYQNEYYYTWIKGTKFSIKVDGTPCGGKNVAKFFATYQIKSFANDFNGNRRYHYWEIPTGAEFLCTRTHVNSGDVTMSFHAECHGGCHGQWVYDIMTYNHMVMMVEEVIPEDWNYGKPNPDCRAATVYNTIQTDRVGATGSLGDDDTVLPSYIDYVKRDSGSTLHLVYSEQVWHEISDGTLKFEIRINGVEGSSICEDENDIYGGIYRYSYGRKNSRGSPFTGTIYLTVDGICRGLPAGIYRIQGYSVWSQTAKDALYDFIQPAGAKKATVGIDNLGQNFIAEEVNEGVPVNAVLTRDGELRGGMPFNRRYGINGPNSFVETALDNAVFRTLTYKKVHETSSLHIRFYDGYGMWHKNRAPQSEFRFLVTIDGALCEEPQSVFERIVNKWAEFKWAQPGYIEGYCTSTVGSTNGIPAGDHEIQLKVKHVLIHISTVMRVLVGAGTTGHWMVEEIFPNFYPIPE